MTKEKVIPQIRFSGFTDTWEQREVSNVAMISAGGTPSTAINEYWNPKQVPWLSSGEVHKKYITYTDDKISNEGLNHSSARMIKQNSVLIALAGQGKTRGTVAINRISLSTNQSIAAMTFAPDICPEFVFSNLESRYDELRKVSSGDGTRGGLNKQLVSEIQIPYTSLNEQRKIGQFFTHLDRLITLHQRKYDKLTKVKKAMLEKMFPKNGSLYPEIRFKGFTDAWEQRELGELVEFYNGDRSSRYPNDSDMVSDGVPFINAGDLVSGRVKLDTANKITEEKFNELSGTKIQRGDIIYCLRGTLGKNAFVDNFDVGTVASSLVDIRPKKVVGKYLFQVLNSDIEYTQRTVNDEGAAQPNLSAKNLSLFNIPMPDEIEQEKIAAYFDDLDRLITLHQRM